MRFKHFILNEQDPMMGGPPGGPPGSPPPLGGDPMGGMGGPPGAPLGADPMGGGMGGAPPMGGGGGMPGDPMGGGMGGPGMGGGMAPQVPVNMKDRDVWQVLGDLLGDKSKPGGDKQGDMIQSPSPAQGMKPGFLMQ